MKFLGLVIIVSSAFYLRGQGIVDVGGSSSWINLGSPSIVLENSQLNIQGTWQSASEEVRMQGTASFAQSSIGSAATLNIYDLIIDKSANGALLTTDLSIKNSIDLQDGLVDLNGNTIDLDNASILNETETNYIFGTAGSITTSLVLNAPTQLNPGNIGSTITSTANFGLTTFTRVHSPVTYGSYEGIYRQIDLVPTNNSGLNTTFRLHYFDHELNGKVESELTFWINHGSGWEELVNSGADAANNWVEVSGINSFSSLSLTDDSNPLSPPLPVELLFFRGKEKSGMIVLEWETASELNNEKFEIMKISRNGDWGRIGEISGNGTTGEKHSYRFVDRSPISGTNFYQLIQRDYDGKYEKSSVISVQFELAESEILWFPNPAGNYIKIGTTEQFSHLEIFDARGINVLSTGIFSDEISIETLPAGSYSLVFKGNEVIATGRLVKK